MTLPWRCRRRKRCPWGNWARRDTEWGSSTGAGRRPSPTIPTQRSNYRPILRNLRRRWPHSPSAGCAPANPIKIQWKIRKWSKFNEKFENDQNPMKNVYGIGVSGEFAVDPGRAAASGHVGDDRPVSGVAPGAAVAVVEPNGRHSERLRQILRQRHAHLVRSAHDAHGLLQRPRHTPAASLVQCCVFQSISLVECP